MNINMNSCIIECKERLEHLGFVRRGKTFGRIINDVFQTFSIEYLRSYREWRADFGVLPLCMDIVSKCPYGEYDSSMFVIKKEFISIDSAQSFNQLIEVLDSIIVPLFSKAIDCATAFNELKILDKKEENIRLKNLTNLCISDSAEPFENRKLWGSVKYYYALKLHDYEYALRHVNYRLQVYERQITNDEQILNDRLFEESFLSSNRCALIQKRLYNTKTRVEKLEKEKEKILKGDYGYFDRSLQETERKSLYDLKKYIPKSSH